MACNPVGSLHRDSHRHHPALGLPGPSTLWKKNGSEGSVGPLGAHRTLQCIKGWDHIQLFADVGFPTGCSMLALSAPSSCIFRIILLPGSPKDGDCVRSGAGTRLCLHSSFTNLFSPAGSLSFLSQSNRFFQGDLKGTLPNSDTCRQANIPINTFTAPALASTPLERDARSSLPLNNHSGLSLVAPFIRRAQSFPPPAGHQELSLGPCSGSSPCGSHWGDSQRDTVPDWEEKPPLSPLPCLRGAEHAWAELQHHPMLHTRLMCLCSPFPGSRVPAEPSPAPGLLQGVFCTLRDLEIAVSPEEPRFAPGTTLGRVFLAPNPCRWLSPPLSSRSQLCPQSPAPHGAGGEAAAPLHQQ